MSREHVVVGLSHCGSHLRGGGDGERDLALTSELPSDMLQDQRVETRAGSSTSGVEHSEGSESAAVVGELADAIGDGVDDLLADGVATAGEVVGGILLGLHEVLGVEELFVSSMANLIDNVGLKVNKEGTRDHLARRELIEHGAAVLVAGDRGEDILMGGDRAVRADACSRQKSSQQELPVRPIKEAFDVRFSYLPEYRPGRRGWR